MLVNCSLTKCVVRGMVTIYSYTIFSNFSKKYIFLIKIKWNDYSLDKTQIITNIDMRWEAVGKFKLVHDANPWTHVIAMRFPIPVSHLFTQSAHVYCGPPCIRCWPRRWRNCERIIFKFPGKVKIMTQTDVKWKRGRECSHEWKNWKDIPLSSKENGKTRHT